jgi:hypothetical protein
MKRRHFITLSHALRHSIVPYDDYYGKVLHETKLGFSLKYFFALSSLLILFELTVAFIGFGKAYPFLKMDTGLRSIIEQLPDDLVINLQGGHLTTNSDRPVIVFNPDMSKPGTLLVIDQFANREKLAEYETQYLFTGREFISKTNGRVMSFEYGDKDFTSSTMTLELGRIARNASTFIFMLYVFAIFLLPILATAARIMLLFFISLVAFILCYKIIPKLSLSKVFQISLHAATAPIIIQTVLTICGLAVPMSFWWFNAMTIIFLLAALYEAYILSARSH